MNPDEFDSSMARGENEQMKPSGRIYIYPGAGQNGHNAFTVGTFEDLRAEGFTPTEGMSMRFWCDDSDDKGNPDPLLFEATIHYDAHLRYWYALIDEKTYRHASDELRNV
jgi:hypothetical protein